MKRTLALSVALTAFALLASPAGADASITIDSATTSDGIATVSGSVSFPAITAPESVLGDEATFGAGSIPPEVMDAAGLAITNAKIMPIDGGLRFSWNVANMPAQVPPEGVRYTWSFKIGTTQYQLQAKRTNLVSVTTAEDPVNHVQQAAAQKNFFQLRGACVTSYEGLPVSGCYHLAFLNGTFDIPNKTITMDLPYQTRDDIGRIVADDFRPGAVLLENQTAAMSIAASFQAVVSNTTVSNYINAWSPYYAGGRVQLAVGAAGTDPSELTFGPAVTISGGTFTGTVSGVDGAANTIFARACNGATCMMATHTF